MEWIQTIDTATNDGLPFLPDDIKRQVAVGRAHPSSCWSGSPCRRRCWRAKGGGSGCCRRVANGITVPAGGVEPGALTGYAGHRYQW